MKRGPAQDARKWLEDRELTDRIICPHKKPDNSKTKTIIWSAQQNSSHLDWAEWNEGKRYEFAALAAAAHPEWQKRVKSPITAGTIGGHILYSRHRNRL